MTKTSALTSARSLGLARPPSASGGHTIMSACCVSAPLIPARFIVHPEVYGKAPVARTKASTAAWRASAVTAASRIAARAAAYSEATGVVGIVGRCVAR